MNFDHGENDIEASVLYSYLKFTKMDEFLDIFLHPSALLLLLNKPKTMMSSECRCGRELL